MQQYVLQHLSLSVLMAVCMLLLATSPLQGAVLVFALVLVLINLLVDLSYTWLDPRITYA